MSGIIQIFILKKCISKVKHEFFLAPLAKVSPFPHILPIIQSYLFIFFFVLFLKIKFIGITLVNNVISFRCTILSYIICVLHCVLTTQNLDSFSHYILDSLYPLHPPHKPLPFW